MNDLINKCEFIITHGGTGSIIMPLQNNKKVIACARLEKYKEHINNHQTEIVSIFADLGYLLEYKDGDNLDGLNYLSGKTMGYVNKKAMEATIEAHVTGGVPNVVINMDKLDARSLGHLIYFFELACAMSGNILGVNPFNQPGVEEYKKNMFKLLKKPGY